MPEGLTTAPGTERLHKGGERKGQKDPKNKPLPMRRVRGIASHLDDLTLYGEALKGVIGDAFTGGSLSRRTTGASELSISFLDPGRKLLNSKLLAGGFDVYLDGLAFTFVALEDGGKTEPTTLKFEPKVAAELRKIKGPHKFFRDRVTRAEAAKRLAWMLDPNPRFICPQLHVIQPIASPKDSREAKQEAEDSSGKGLSEHNADLKVKGEEANPEQVKLGDAALRIAEEKKAPRPVMVALIASLIDETEMGRVDPGNPLQATPSSKSGSNEQDIAAFLTGGWGAVSNGAIGFYNANPGASPAEIATGVQANRDGASSYEPFVKEAEAWVDGYGGSASETITTTEKFAWTQGKDVSNWAMIAKMANDVNWRFFESAGWLYFIAEPDLFRSVMRGSVGDSTPGIVDTVLKYDANKVVQEITVEANAKPWSAPPGTVVNVTDHGPGDGIYIVEKIDAPLTHRDSVCSITLKRPTKPLPEPAPKTTTKTLGISGGAVGTGELGSLAGTPKEIVDRVVEYAHEKYGFDVSPSSVEQANAEHGPTVDGNRSDHQGPPDYAWAADISNGTSTPEEAQLAADIAAAFDIPYHGTRTTGMLANATHGGFAMQLIHNTTEGGDHYDHVHFGLHRA